MDCGYRKIIAVLPTLWTTLLHEFLDTARDESPVQASEGQELSDYFCYLHGLDASRATVVVDL